MATIQTFTAGQILTAAQLNTLQGYVGVVQVKSAVKTDTFTTSSTSYVDVTGISVSITPTSASNKILILSDTKLLGQTGVVTAFLQLVRDSTPIYLGAAAGSRTQASSAARGDPEGGSPSANIFLDSPATTSAVTYKVQIAANSVNTIYVNRSQSDTDTATRGRLASSITVMEVTP